MELGNCTVLNTINKPCVIPTKRIISLPKPGVCGMGYLNNSDIDIEGEFVTKIDQFPWTALLKYRNGNVLAIIYRRLKFISHTNHEPLIARYRYE